MHLGQKEGEPVSFHGSSRKCRGWWPWLLDSSSSSARQPRGHDAVDEAVKYVSHPARYSESGVVPTATAVWHEVRLLGSWAPIQFLHSGWVLLWLRPPIARTWLCVISFGKVVEYHVDRVIVPSDSRHKRYQKACRSFRPIVKNKYKLDRRLSLDCMSIATVAGRQQKRRLGSYCVGRRIDLLCDNNERVVR